MLTLLLIIFIIISAGCFIMNNIFDTDDALNVVGCLCSLFVIGIIIAMMVVGGNIKKYGLIDDKISIYEEENQKIEATIAELVDRYAEHEGYIIEKCAPDKSIAVVSMYPELKKDELVKSQIEIYTENMKQVAELKVKKLDASVYKWWLYFGG